MAGAAGGAAEVVASATAGTEAATRAGCAATLSALGEGWGYASGVLGSSGPCGQGGGQAVQRFVLLSV